MSSITGTVSYRQRIALAPGAVVRVRLEDVSKQDVAAVLVAETEIVTAGEQVPIPFALGVDPGALVPRGRYALRAWIEVEGELRFATTTHSPLPDDWSTTPVELWVEAATAKPLGGTTWRLVELDGAAVELDENETAPELVLDLGTKRVAGSGGCNRLLGSFETDGTTLVFGPVATTLMACAEAVMRREQTFLRALEATTGYELDEVGLRLLAGDDVVARLEAGDSGAAWAEVPSSRATAPSRTSSGSRSPPPRSPR